MVFLPLDVILLSFDDSNMLFSYLVVTIQKGNDQHRLLPRTKGPWYAKTSMSSSSPSSSKSSVSSKSSKKSLSSKKQKMRCFGGPVQAQVPSISPAPQTSNEPIDAVTQQPSAQDSNATSALPTLVPIESSYPTDIAVGTGSPTTSEFPASNASSNPASIEPSVPTQSPVTETLAIGLIEICQTLCVQCHGALPSKNSLCLTPMFVSLTVKTFSPRNVFTTFHSDPDLSK